MYVADDDVCRAARRDEDDGAEAHHGEGGGIADLLFRSKEPVVKKGRTRVKEATKVDGGKLG